MRSTKSPGFPDNRGATSIAARSPSRRTTIARTIEAPRAGTPERRAAFARGLSAETRAALLLIAKGYRIAARRWKSPVGEIDIVARRRHLLVFVGVKARGGVDDAAFAVTPS